MDVAVLGLAGTLRMARAASSTHSGAIVHDLEKTRFTVHDMTLPRRSRSRDRGQCFSLFL
jgi:hypothetical protein